MEDSTINRLNKRISHTGKSELIYIKNFIQNQICAKSDNNMPATDTHTAKTPCCTHPERFFGTTDELSYMIRNKQRYTGIFAINFIYNDFKMQIDPSETIKTIASRIKFYRAAQGLTIQELAYRCEMERSNLSRIEAGKSNLTVKTMCIICNALNITLRDLIK